MAEQLPEQAGQVVAKGTLVGKQGRPATLHGKNKSLALNVPKL
jgi:hypothetical protein